MENLPHDETAGHSGFERELPEDTVQYLLFMIDDRADARSSLVKLEALRKEALSLCQDLATDYIWQRDQFNLELKNENGLIYLEGQVQYGDAVEDEWLVVYLLRRLTAENPDLWVRIYDTDGEFLLVEAANVLPKWLSPENDQNRVWLHDEKLLLIPCRDDTNQKLALSEAVRFIKDKSSELVHSTFVEAEAFYRLEKYPGQIQDSLHHSLVTIPRRLAYIVHASPRSVAPAVEAFYLRDAINLKPILSTTSTLTFPPEDLVTVSVRFSKVLYAQLRSQRFETPSRWQYLLPSLDEGVEKVATDERTRRLETGMKLTCGYEILAAKAETSKSRVVREIAIMIEDMKEDGDGILPSDKDIESWPETPRNDQETWLDINYEDFEHELSGRTRRKDTQNEDKGFGDPNAKDNLRKIVSRFEAFLNDETAGPDGAEMDEMDYDDDEDELASEDEDSDEEDKEVSFDEEEFSRLMREMMGFPPTSGTTTTRKHVDTQDTASPRAAETGKTGAQEEEEAGDEDDDVKEIRKITSQLEAELQGHGALHLDPPMKRSNITDSRGQGEVADAQEDSEEEVDVDYNLAKNILESFKSQGGMAGPTGNLLGMMGINLPRDEDDGEDDERRTTK
ncbi:SGT1 domain-containing protein [Emericellopsis atlantica]|uniref:SGT1 domain-containing protein n=1 Tax=Emericellopsis atlantica TaxID=2614577 RepID=A0A9P8CKA5_9HYPO|nr:SGT1 domain-containing protein [Emericellopsis atlantica]KAG9250153.1 SGT1 domain-containing protein [Emericellopsis atlantica]